MKLENDKRNLEIKSEQMSLNMNNLKNELENVTLLHESRKKELNDALKSVFFLFLKFKLKTKFSFINKKSLMN